MSAISLFEEKQVRRAWNASEQRFRLIQSIPSPDAEPFKRWHSELKVGQPPASATARKKSTTRDQVHFYLPMEELLLIPISDPREAPVLNRRPRPCRTRTRHPSRLIETQPSVTQPALGILVRLRG
jgi:hypothetical protein